MSDFRLPKRVLNQSAGSVDGPRLDAKAKIGTPTIEPATVELRSGYQAGRQLPTQVNPAGSGLKHLVSARTSDAERIAVRSAGLKAILPGASAKTTFAQALKKVAGRGPEQLQAIATRLETIAGPEGPHDAATLREAVLGPIARFVSTYADPDSISTDNPLQALGRLLSKHSDDERFMAGATAMMAVLRGLAARGGDPEPIIGDLHAASMDLNRGWLSHNDEGQGIRGKIDGMQREVQSIQHRAWSGVGQSIRAEVLAQLDDAAPSSLDDVRAMETQIDERLSTIELSGQRLPQSFRDVRRDAKAGAPAFAQQRAQQLINSDFVKSASASELRQLRDILTQTARWNDPSPEAFKTAMGTVTAALVKQMALPGTEAPLHEIHSYVSQLVQIGEVDDPAVAKQVATKLHGAAQLAASTPALKGEFDYISSSMRFSQLADIATHLPKGDALRGKLETMQTERVADLMKDRLHAVINAFGSISQDSVQWYQRDIEAYAAVLMPTLDGPEQEALAKDIESRFAQLGERMERHEQYQSRMSAVSFGSASRRRSSPSGMSMAMKVALITAG